MILHAHIYFPIEQRDRAAALREAVSRAFEGRLLKVSELVDHALGPHPVPTFEIHFDAKLRAGMRDFLEANRNGLSVLIHEDTGDDHRDHRENIEWLGEPVALDFGFFDLILKHPELRINK